MPKRNPENPLAWPPVAEKLSSRSSPAQAAAVGRQVPRPPLSAAFWAQRVPLVRPYRTDPARPSVLSSKEPARAPTTESSPSARKAGRSLADQPAATGEGRTPRNEPFWERPLFGSGVNYSGGREGCLPRQRRARRVPPEERKRFISAALATSPPRTEPPVFTHAARVTASPRPVSLPPFELWRGPATKGALIPAEASRSAAKLRRCSAPVGRSRARASLNVCSTEPTPGCAPGVAEPQAPRGAGHPPTALGCSGKLKDTGRWLPLAQPPPAPRPGFGSSAPRFAACASAPTSSAHGS